MRINVVGTSGSGKTTFSKKLAEAASLPCIEMDSLFWGKNWTMKQEEEFFQAIREHTSGAAWILDGNYSRSISVKWERVQKVIWIDLPFLTTLSQAVKRALKRAFYQEEIWPGTGNRESFKMLFSRDSIVLWTIKTYRKKRMIYRTLMKDPHFSHIEFITLRSRKEMEGFIQKVRLCSGDFT